MKLTYERTNIIRGALIYTLGDTTAALISSSFDWYRMLGMLLVGATVYAFEIPNYFKWIDTKVDGKSGLASSMKRTVLAILYFNPLWVARHLFFIKLFSQQYEDINLHLIEIAWISFVINIPISIIANYLIQNKIRLDWRFMASAIFSALMAIYYAMSAIWFK